MTRIAPIMPPRGYRFPWWWLLTSRQGYRKSMQELFGGFCFCYNAGRHGKRNKPGVIVCSKTAVFRIRAVVTCSQVPRPLPTSRVRGSYSWAGRVVHTQGGIFFGEKLGRFSRIMRAGALPGHGYVPRAQITHTKRASGAAVSELGTIGKTPPRTCDGVKPIHLVCRICQLLSFRRTYLGSS